LNYWSDEEQGAYLAFLKQHMPMITTPEYRKKQRIFKGISALLGIRTPIQVKSHHQKLEDKFKSVSKIIAHLEKELRVDKQEKETEETYSQTPQAEPPSEVEISEEYITVEFPFFHMLDP
jgi:hypothetical protein